MLPTKRRRSKNSKIVKCLYQNRVDLDFEEEAYGISAGRGFVCFDARILNLEYSSECPSLIQEDSLTVALLNLQNEVTHDLNGIHS
jgi:hypothetical protein